MECPRCGKDIFNPEDDTHLCRIDPDSPGACETCDGWGTVHTERGSIQCPECKGSGKKEQE